MVLVGRVTVSGCRRGSALLPAWAGVLSLHWAVRIYACRRASRARARARAVGACARACACVRASACVCLISVSNTVVRWPSSAACAGSTAMANRNVSGPMSTGRPVERSGEGGSPGGAAGPPGKR